MVLPTLEYTEATEDKMSSSRWSWVPDILSELPVFQCCAGQETMCVLWYNH